MDPETQGPGLAGMSSASEDGRFTDRGILRALALGFTLVGVLLTAAALVVTRESQAIRQGNALVAREQLVMARLLHELQVEQNALTEILHRVANLSLDDGPSGLLEDLQAVDDALDALLGDAAEMAPEGSWQALAEEIRAFTSAAREAVAHPQPLSKEQTRRIFGHHDRVLGRVDSLLQASSERLRMAEFSMESQSANFAHQTFLLLVACFAMASICAMVTIRFAARGIRRMEAQSAELTRVSWHMLRSQEETARRFSHELHDELGQSLAALRASLAHGTVSEDRQGDLIRLVDQSIANVREMSQLLRPVILDDFGLDAGLRWLVERFAERTGLDSVYESDLNFRLSDEVETHLFRIAQEALTNIARHSGASRLRVRLEAPGPDSLVRLMIEDNGRGLPLQRGKVGPPGIGMTGMRARASQCGGDLTVEALPPPGVRLTVRLPPSPTRNRAEE
jgi:signal transduction histidine kinase